MPSPTARDRRIFWRDGVVCLRRLLDPDDVAAMAGPVDRALDAPQTTDMTSMRTSLADAGLSVVGGAPTGRFMSGLDHWRADEAFLHFARTPALTEAVATLLDSVRLYLYEDSVLVKEPGADVPTTFHADSGYFHLEGSQIATTWVPLDTVDDSTGAVQYVRGSHRTEVDYRPNYFISDEPIDGTSGETIPPVNSPDLISFDTEPGDVIVHQARTVHGARGNTSTLRRRRAISVRYCGDDVRYQPKAGVPGKPHHDGYGIGDPLGPPAFPQVWPPPVR